MAKSKKSKQRKVAAKRGRKRVKRKQTLSKRRQAQVVSMAGAARYPIHEVLLQDLIFEQGLGVGILSRRLPDERIAMASFVIDAYCLGVKDATARIMNLFDYQGYVDQVELTASLSAVEPAYLVKLVKESVAYAKDLGFNPHRDYKKARNIFGDIDPNTCTETFEFGKDGKPLYISGPLESAAKVRRIVDQLTKRLGPDGFDFLVGMGP